MYLNLVYLQDLIAGGVAGALSKSCVAPLERVKILFQVSDLHGSATRYDMKTQKWIESVHFLGILDW